MSTNEVLVIIGGLFLGYIIMTTFMNQKENKTSEKSRSNYNYDSSQKNKENEKTSNQNANEKSHTKEEFIPANWFRILEVAESASMSEISLQYKRKIREYHPDKVASLGKELRELAEFKSKEINSAYEFAKKLKN